MTKQELESKTTEELKELRDSLVNLVVEGHKVGLNLPCVNIELGKIEVEIQKRTQR